jgi:hypothetical protein
MERQSISIAILNIEISIVGPFVSHETSNGSKRGEQDALHEPWRAHKLDDIIEFAGQEREME